jgi:transcriptional regulator with XRE-family HTH domain
LRGSISLKALGLTIERFRTEQELSQAEVAKRIGLTPRELTRIESGKEEARWGTLRDLADALDVRLWELLLIAEQEGPG